jgi:hypothetical protein
MQRAICFILLSMLLIVQAASAGEPEQLTKKKKEPPLTQDPNVPLSAVAPGAATRSTPGVEDMGLVADQVMAQQAPSDPTLCAIVVLPGPAASFTARVGVFNVAAARLDTLSMDSFRALGGQSLLHQSVFNTVAPAAGTLTVLYPPAEEGKGPVVLSFTNFNEFDSVAFSMDPDTYDNPDFGVTVLDMDQTSIELVYAGGLRCQGTLLFDAGLNASTANIVQVFP